MKETYKGLVDMKIVSLCVCVRERKEGGSRGENESKSMKELASSNVQPYPWFCNYRG